MSCEVCDKMYGRCNFENNLNQTKLVNFKKHSPIVFLTSKKFYSHQYPANFTHFVSLARELVLHSWLTFRENCPYVLMYAIFVPYSESSIEGGYRRFFAGHFCINCRLLKLKMMLNVHIIDWPP